MNDLGVGLKPTAGQQTVLHGVIPLDLSQPQSSAIRTLTQPNQGTSLLHWLT